MVAEAVAALRAHGPEASEALAKLLRAPGVPARRALELLTEFGDRRALTALGDRLQACYEHRLAVPVADGILLVACLALFVCSFAWGVSNERVWIFCGSCTFVSGTFVAASLRSLALQGTAATGYLNALRALVSRDPCTEVRAHLGALDTIADAVARQLAGDWRVRRCVLPRVTESRQALDEALVATAISWEYRLRFAPFGPDVTFDEVAGQLQSVYAPHAAAACAEMRRWGVAGVAPLCEALRHPHPTVRGAAALSLGYTGNRRAIQPLLSALKGSCIGGSAERQRRLGLLLAAVALLIVGPLTGMLALQHVVLAGLALSYLWRSGLRLWEKRRGRNRLSAVIADALSQIAERDPSPELRQALPAIRALARDFVHQTEDARAVSQRAAERIDTLADTLRDLPIPAEAPVPDPLHLPTPGVDPSIDRAVE